MITRYSSQVASSVITPYWIFKIESFCDKFTFRTAVKVQKGLVIIHGEMALSTTARLEMAMQICKMSREDIVTDSNDENDPETIIHLNTVCLKVMTAAIKAQGEIPSLTETWMRTDDKEAWSFRCKASLWKLSTDKEASHYESKITLYKELLTL